MVAMSAAMMATAAESEEATFELGAADRFVLACTDQSEKPVVFAVTVAEAVAVAATYFDGWITHAPATYLYLKERKQPSETDK
jgi:hypothetical protein